MHYFLVFVLNPCNNLLYFDTVAYSRPVFIITVLVFLFPHIKLVYIACFVFYKICLWEWFSFGSAQYSIFYKSPHFATSIFWKTVETYQAATWITERQLPSIILRRYSNHLYPYGITLHVIIIGTLCCEEKWDKSRCKSDRKPKNQFEQTFSRLSSLAIIKQWRQKRKKKWF